MKSRILYMIIAVLILSVSCTKEVYIHVGPNWESLEKLRPGTENFNIYVDAEDEYVEGEPIDITVNSERSGRLWILQVDSNDDVSMLFPNEMDENNAIPANIDVKIPPTGADWKLSVSEPFGEAFLVFIVTTGSTDLSDVLENQKSFSKTIHVVSNDPQWVIEKMIINIKRKDE